ncbi:hypothetical protein [Micromonospora sp. NPDC093277]|uniref:hypothetical protein n=1 Tax=Micromonospora sp. NPDC093277 TaxID=3364291 RepID=UPI00380C8496
MSEPAEDPGTSFLDRHRVGPPGAYRRLIGAHRAAGLGGPSRGYLFTVALLAGTASMPILAAISTGSATVGNSAPPDNSTPFIPTPSIGPVVVPLPNGTQPPLRPSRSPAATGTPWPVQVAAPAVLALPDDRDPGGHRRFRPAGPPSAPGPVGATRTASPRPPRVPAASPSPSASGPVPPDPSPRPTSEPTSTFSGPAGDPPTATGATPTPRATGAEPTPTDPVGTPPSAGAPEAPPASTACPIADQGPSPDRWRGWLRPGRR